MMIAEVCRSVNNYFAKNKATNDYYFPPQEGRFKIEDEVLTGVPEKPVVGSYFAITGSALNNGVYLAEDDLITVKGALNEEFDGVLYRLAIPREFVGLVKRIEEFANSDEGKTSNVVSASFGIQSVSFSVGRNGLRAGWETAFAGELHRFRRHSPDVVF